MLSNRSRAVTSKQAIMSDHSSQQSSPSYYTAKIPSFFGSPRFRAFFTMKGQSETDQNPLISPTSILDTKLSFPFGIPFSCDKNQPKSIPRALSGNKRSWDNAEAKGIGLALVDTLIHEKSEENTSTTTPATASKPSNGSKVLFGTKLRVQIPPYLATTGSANSGIQGPEISPQAFTRSVSVSEMELSEEYTCVISRGPNPRTTHIFDNCIVESYYTLSDSGHFSKSAPENFLSFCYTCKKNLEQKIDIYIYRGDKAFCSKECRYQEMLLDDGFGNPEF